MRFVPKNELSHLLNFFTSPPYFTTGITGARRTSSSIHALSCNKIGDSILFHTPEFA